jgi:D-alanyl-D-alanine carboxypeptidase/D-alanyl-D-alanine-endopeptidase (penicillin-binding protein 4)
MLGMRSVFQCWCWLLSVCLVTHGWAQDSTDPLQKDIETLIQKEGLLSHQAGVIFMPVSSRQHLVEIQPQRLFKPASTIKLLTAWASLQRWSSNHRFYTKVLHYKNSLCIQGGGDPGLVQENLFQLAEDVTSKIIVPISEVYVDDSLFTPDRHYAQAFEQDANRAFTAPVSSMSVNYNAASVMIQATDPKEKPIVRVKPDIDFFKVDNRATTSKRRHSPQVDFLFDQDHYNVRIGGKVRPYRTKVYHRAITEPSLYAGHLFAHYYGLLQQTPIQTVSVSGCPPDAKEVASVPSLPLSTIVQRMNKFSNNMMAEMLFYQLGESNEAGQGMAYFESFLKKQNLLAPNITLENGSGLSHRTMVTPDWMMQLLTKMYDDFQSRPEIFSSMGISGTDGTLRRRLNEKEIIAKIRGKSGSLKDASALAGVLETAQWGEVLFVMFFDHPNVPRWKIFDLEEKIFQRLTQQKSTQNK